MQICSNQVLIPFCCFRLLEFSFAILYNSQLKLRQHQCFCDDLVVSRWNWNATMCSILFNVKVMLSCKDNILHILVTRCLFWFMVSMNVVVLFYIMHIWKSAAIWYKQYPESHIWGVPSYFIVSIYFPCFLLSRKSLFLGHQACCFPRPFFVASSTIFFQKSEGFIAALYSLSCSLIHRIFFWYLPFSSVFCLSL